MWHTTTWAIKTWFKISIALAVVVGLVWLFTDRPGYTTAAVVLAALTDLWAIQALAREVVLEGRTFCWWWPK